MPYSNKAQKRKQQRENTMASPVSGVDAVMAARPISLANPEGGENCFTTMTQHQQHQIPEQSQRESDNITGSDKQSLASDWNGFEELSDQGPTPDINITLPGE